jgi:hypothetical protein
MRRNLVQFELYKIFGAKKEKREIQRRDAEKKRKAQRKDV